MRPHSLFSPIQSQTRHNLHQPKASVLNFAPSSVRTTIGKSVKNVEIERQVLSNGACEAVHSILIQRLPAIVTEKSLQRILVGSKDLISVKILPKQPGGSSLNSALVCIKTLNAAVEAKKVLVQNLNLHNDSWTEVEILLVDPEYLSRLYALKYIPTIISSSSPLPAKVPGVSSLCQITQTNNHFHLPQRVSLTSTASTRSESPSTRDEMLFQSHFFPQSPIGNHMTRQVRFNGKALINDTSMINNETDASLKTSIFFVENGLSYQKEQRQLPNSTNPLHRTAGLSLNPVINTGSVQFSDYSSSDLISSELSGSMMPKIPLKSRDLSITCQHGTLLGQHPKFPVINHSDHNPPCNTLYVGNLPNKTSEDELKTIFSKQRGYKRLCFRTKQNGPMCFVEFEDVSFATKALHELYGLPLHNSVKGGIRLSFSKNPLGVRSAQSRIISIPQNTSSSIVYKDGIFINTQKNWLGTTIGAPPGLVSPPDFGPTQFGFATAMSPMASVNGYHGIPAHADNDHRYDWTPSASHRMSAGRFPTIRYHEFSANTMGR